MTFFPCAIIPCRNHYKVLESIIDRLIQAGLKVFIIDDASDLPAQQALQELAKKYRQVELYRFSINQGKGGAVLKGFELAITQGFSHALQIDADGQHDIEALPRLLLKAAQNPNALISAIPIFDASIPRSRQIGRWITKVWVWVETLSFSISDAMCGFRIYPLIAVHALLKEVRLGRYMDFDIDIIVHLYSRRVPLIEMPVKVVYPVGNTSNFRMFQDNLQISIAHSKLVLQMILRLLKSARLRSRRQDIILHWWELQERGGLWGIVVLALIYRYLGRYAAICVLVPIVLIFHFIGKEQRQASRAFLTRAFAISRYPKSPNWYHSWKHFINFGIKAIDAIGSWNNPESHAAVVYGSPSDAERLHADSRGALLIVSHIGNNDISRALLTGSRGRRLTILVHTRHAENYNRVVQHFISESQVELMQVTEIGPETAIILQTRIDNGEWVAIAGDRTPVTGKQHTILASFLGKEACFSTGPYLLAHLLKCPVYLLFCLREKYQYRVWIEFFAEHIVLPRSTRNLALRQYTETYAKRLESFALQDPLQWYNFFDFWAVSRTE